jgi:aminopeptidase N
MKINMLFLLWICFTVNLLHASPPEPGIPIEEYSTILETNPLRSCFDVTAYKLDIRFDVKKKSLAGNVSIFFNVISDFDQFQIDLFENLQIDSILFENKQIEYNRNERAVMVDFPVTMKIGKYAFIKVYYRGKPIRAKNAPWDGGFDWKQDIYGNVWAGVACEGDGASIWWPCKDDWKDEPDTVTMNYTVPDDLWAVGNGRLLNVAENNDNTITYAWQVLSPINLYNVTVNIAKYAHFHDTYIGKDTLDLDYYVLEYNLEKAKIQFEQVKPMMQCYEYYFGPYPFYVDGFKMVETPYLGMEHQSAIAYGNHYLKGYMGYDYSGLGFDYIIIHESAHEWFGNSISAPDISEMWIHETFTTYAEALYVEYMSDYDNAVKYLKTQVAMIINSRPIVSKRNGLYGSGSTDNDMYYKGSWMLHSIRSTINNDELWFKALKGFSGKFYHQVISTDDVIRYFNEATQKDLTSIFKQYLYSAKRPVLEYEIITSGTKKILRYRWQAGEDGFNMPVVIYQKKKETRIYPETTFKELVLKKNQTLHFDKDKFYFRTKKIN